MCVASVGPWWLRRRDVGRRVTLVGAQTVLGRMKWGRPACFWLLGRRGALQDGVTAGGRVRPRVGGGDGGRAGATAGGTGCETAGGRVVAQRWWWVRQHGGDVAPGDEDTGEGEGRG